MRHACSRVAVISHIFLLNSLTSFQYCTVIYETYIWLFKFRSHQSWHDESILCARR